jgi:hypothetical protein
MRTAAAAMAMCAHAVVHYIGMYKKGMNEK